MGCPRLPYPEENRSSLFVSASNFDGERKSSGKNYETFFRQYDPALGRMTGIDPMAVKYSGLSPYNYAFNDPVAWNDPYGDDPIEWGENGELYIYWDQLPENGGSFRQRVGDSFYTNGGRWVYHDFVDLPSAFTAGWNYNNYHNSWGYVEGGQEGAIGRYADAVGGVTTRTRNGYSVTHYNTLNRSYYGNEGNYAGAFFIEPNTIEVKGMNPSYTRIEYDFASFFVDSQQKEPYTGVLGTLEYIWTGGIEDGIRYDKDGNFLGYVTSGLGAAEYVGGPGGTVQLAFKAEALFTKLANGALRSKKGFTNIVTSAGKELSNSKIISAIEVQGVEWFTATMTASKAPLWTSRMGKAVDWGTKGKKQVPKTFTGKVGYYFGEFLNFIGYEGLHPF